MKKKRKQAEKDLKAQEELDAAAEARFDELIDSEFAFVKKCFYVEPEDQSGWLYHRWLLGKVVASGPELPALGISLGTPVSNLNFNLSPYVVKEETREKETKYDHSNLKEDEKKLERRRKRQYQVFERELKMCRELHQEEPDCKWLLLAIATLLAGMEACKPSPKAEYENHRKEIKQIFDKLIELDGLRRQHYIDVRASLLKNIDQV